MPLALRSDGLSASTTPAFVHSGEYHPCRVLLLSAVAPSVTAPIVLPKSARPPSLPHLWAFAFLFLAFSPVLKSRHRYRAWLSDRVFWELHSPPHLLNAQDPPFMLITHKELVLLVTA